uniref:Uncharacterized protein n=1 Tax=Angiostrongylus cantonensis TaxID=6313 RepID=A0A0K0DCT6_ANGCA
MRLIYVFLLVEYSAQVHERTVWEEAPVDFIPPPNWDNYELPRPIKQYMEYEWSLSSYTNECEDEQSLKIVPVYFWPGDQVDLPCLMCELAFVFNGKMKMWGKAVDVLKFLEDPKASPASQGVYFCYDSQSRSHTTIFYVVMAITPPVRMSDMKGVLSRLFESLYDMDILSRLLVIKQVVDDVNFVTLLLNIQMAELEVFSQCQERCAMSFTGRYYRQLPILLDLNVKNEYSRNFIFEFKLGRNAAETARNMDDVCGEADGCYDTKDYGFIRANFNWRYHFVPNIRHEAPKQCHGGKEGFCEKNYFTQVDSEKDCTLDFCRKEFKESKIELNLALEIRWEPWGECVGGRQLQKREDSSALLSGTKIRLPNSGPKTQQRPRLDDETQRTIRPRAVYV